ncbi:MAG: hypothetical protein ABSE40_15600 [Candidatus Sulfotelmatobacter sp.]|jgi:hypothetical protein
MIQTLSEGPRRRQDYDFKSKLWAGAVVAVVATCSFQLWWFARTCFNEIDYDGVGYLGIARHIRQGEFYAAINSIRSPLISWLIAGLSFTDGDYLHLGKLVNVLSFLMCALLLYVLAESLWRSRLAAALATLLFVLGRGLAAAAVESITPDFLFAALTLVYFLFSFASPGARRGSSARLVFSRSHPRCDVPGEGFRAALASAVHRNGFSRFR